MVSSNRTNYIKEKLLVYVSPLNESTEDIHAIHLKLPNDSHKLMTDTSKGLYDLRN